MTTEGAANGLHARCAYQRMETHCATALSRCKSGPAN